MPKPTPRPMQILLVEDNADDILLVEEAFGDANVANELHAVRDGEAAMDYLGGRGEFEGQELPDIVILDLNLPKKNGRAVLREIKQEETLKQMPVIVLSASGAPEDVLDTYNHHVNAYIQKPVDFDEFIRAVRALDEFWLSVVRLPGRAA